MKHEQTYQLLARFFSLLEERGWQWGLDQQLRIQQLMARLPVPVSEDVLRSSLIAILATNKEEQEKLTRWFKEVLKEEPVRESLHPEKETGKKGFNIKKLWWLPLLLLLLIVGLYFVFKPDPVVHTDYLLEFFKTIQVDTGSSATLCEQELRLALQNNLKQVEEVRLCSGNKDTIASFGALSLTAKTCPLTYTAGLETGLDSFCLEILGRNDSLFKLTLFVSVERSPSPPPDIDSVEIPLPTIALPYDVDIADLAVDELSPGEKFLQANLWWLKIAALLLLGMLLGLWLWWREYKRQKVIAKLGGNDKPPYFWNIKLDDVADSIDLGPTFSQLLNRLRQRQLSEIEELDVEKTIEQTAAQAGRFSFAYRARTKAPEYLLLIDKQGLRNHQAQLFEHIYQLFRKNEVTVTRFFYKADPRKCFNEDFPAGIPLSEVQRQYYQARLLVLGNGYQLLSSRNGQLASWTRLFEGWKERSLLSTQPTNSWGRREGQLGQLFVLLPASLRSIELLLEQLDVEGEANAELLRKKLSGIHQESIELEGGLIETLQSYYSPAMQRWIAACAIFPTLHWDLTLYWGEYFSTPQDYLLESPKILSLTRLPWFVEGRIPTEARKVLLNWLDKEEKGLLPQLRDKLSGILHQKQNQPPKESMAFEEYRMAIAFNQWLTTTDPKLKKQLEEEIARLIEAGIEPDFAVAELQEKAQDSSEFTLPDSWKRSLYKGGLPRLGWQRLIKEGIAALSLLILLGLGSIFIPPPVSQCTGNPVPYIDDVQDTTYTLCLKNTKDSIIYFQQLARDTLSNPAHLLVVDSLALQVEKKAVADSIKNIFNHNIGAALYNEGVALKSNAGLTPSDSALCAYFSRANELWENNPRIRSAYLNQLISGCGEGVDADCPIPEIRASLDPGPNPYLCPGESVRITNTSSGQEELEYYLIDWGDGTIDSVLSFSSLEHQYSEAIADRPSIVIAGAILCQGAPKYSYLTLVVPLESVPLVSLKLPDSICTDTSIGTQIQVQVSSSNNQYAWNFGDGTTSNKPQPDHKYNQEGTYTLQVAVQNRCGEANAEAELSVRECDLAAKPTPIDTPPPPVYPLPEMVYIPGDSFQMGNQFNEGDSNEKPVHKVKVASFFMSAHEVTFEQYDAFCAATNREKPDDENWGRGKRPVINVSWYDAIEYCNWLSRVSGYDPAYSIDKENQDPNNRSSYDGLKWMVSINENANGFRLPTEAEWEYAARERGRKVRFGNGKDIADPAEMNFNAKERYKRPYSLAGKYRGKTTEVGSFGPNSLDLYDMSGNVWEWCWDWYDANYYEQSDGAINPKGPSSGSDRVVRGGSWDDDPDYCRASFRNGSNPLIENGIIGFRLIRHQ